uniref:HTH psq-type domain-containing protein n=1 Tax=Psilocybe cubensis TaxID=181762 RepID=A0A8H7XNR1_PSICU
MSTTSPVSPHDSTNDDIPDLINNTVENRIQEAIQAIMSSPLKSNGQHTLSIREACRIYSVKRGMLTNRLNGVKTKRDAHAGERALSDAEESILVDWAKTLGRRGFPVTQDMLREYASVSAILLYCMCCDW